MQLKDALGQLWKNPPRVKRTAGPKKDIGTMAQEEAVARTSEGKSTGTSKWSPLHGHLVGSGGGRPRTPSKIPIPEDVAKAKQRMLAGNRITKAGENQELRVKVRRGNVGIPLHFTDTTDRIALQVARGKGTTHDYARLSGRLNITIDQAKVVAQEYLKYIRKLVRAVPFPVSKDIPIIYPESVVDFAKKMRKK